MKWIVVILTFILLVSAFLHGLSYGTEQYQYSSLIYIEFALSFLLIFLIPAYIISALVAALKRNWVGLRVIVINLAFGIIFIYGALISDAPTLIHMT